MNFPFISQLDSNDCGPVCLKMISDYYGRKIPLQTWREKCYSTKEGVSIASMSDAAEAVGFQAIAVKTSFDSLPDKTGLLDIQLPVIAYWELNHFVVIYKINNKHVWLADPAAGKIKITKDKFINSWGYDNNNGVILAVYPTKAFYDLTEVEDNSGYSFRVLLDYVIPHKKLALQFLLGMVVGLILQSILPFLTQSMIDVGIGNRNIDFVSLILFSQLVLYSSQTIVEFIQRWIILEIGSRINIHLVSDFLIKLMKLPMRYFDSKNIGDLLQRIHDNSRVESFLTGSVFNIFFSFVSAFVFSFIILWYNSKIFLMFIAFTSVYLIWVLYFMKRRAELDALTFKHSAASSNALYELVNGMQEIKLQGSERKRRWRWIDTQGKLFHLNKRTMLLTQYQDFGATFINRTKDVLISVISVKAVIDGDITLGALFTIQYIIGQLNAPFDQMIDFLRSAQDCRLSLSRLSEIATLQPEENSNNLRIADIPVNSNIDLEDVSFTYGSVDENILKNVNLTIPVGKVTAIVGASGSGKTTLLKLLLGFYEPIIGKISVGGIPLNAIEKKIWRSKCGCVMQEGFVFSDTIAANIAESDDKIDFVKLDNALRIANIRDYVYGLPHSYNTLIGTMGNGLSQGQRQRLLIARAVYKNPDFLFFDEATNSLDSINENVIMLNLKQFYKNKTVIIVAHRLSTVKNADTIVVLDSGKIIEQGTHEYLAANKGKYYELVRNQLDLE